MRTDTRGQKGRRDSAGADAARVHRIVAEHNHRVGALFAILEHIQAEYGYLPEQALRTVSELTGRSLVDMYGVATFYRSFRLQPPGRHLIVVCLGTACHVRGAPRVIEQLERELGIRRGGTTPDGAFTLETVNCLGACALGPVVVVDGEYFPNVDRVKVTAILDRLRSEALKAVPATGSA